MNPIDIALAADQAAQMVGNSANGGGTYVLDLTGWDIVAFLNSEEVFTMYPSIDSDTIRTLNAAVQANRPVYVKYGTEESTINTLASQQSAGEGGVKIIADFYYLPVEGEQSMDKVTVKNVIFVITDSTEGCIAIKLVQA